MSKSDWFIDINKVNYIIAHHSQHLDGVASCIGPFILLLSFIGHYHLDVLIERLLITRHPPFICQRLFSFGSCWQNFSRLKRRDTNFTFLSVTHFCHRHFELSSLSELLIVLYDCFWLSRVSGTLEWIEGCCYASRASASRQLNHSQCNVMSWMNWNVPLNGWL